MPHGFLSGTASSDSGNTNSVMHCEPNYGCSQQFLCSEVTGWSLYLSPKGFSASPGFDTDIYHNRVLPNILLLSSVYLWNVLGGDPTLFWFFFYLYPSDLVLNLPAISFPTFSFMISLSSLSPQAAKSLLSSIFKEHCFFPRNPLWALKVNSGLLSMFS